jgi:hypothetical protein
MGELLTPTHRMVVAIVAFVLFGGKRVSAPGRLGRSRRLNVPTDDNPGTARQLRVVRHQ